MEYRILFIDEEKKICYNFANYVEDSEFAANFEVHIRYPLSSRDEMLDEIIKLSPDAIISDYRLNEKRTDIDYNVPYTGVELVEEFQNIREGFPCFIMTSFDDDAMIESEDVNKVYIKEILHRKEVEQGAKVSFLGRVIKQIENYKSRIKNTEKRLQELLDLKKNNSITLKEEEELIKLDSFLERSIDKESSVPKNLKKITNEEKLQELLEKTNLLLDKLGGKK